MIKKIDNKNDVILNLTEIFNLEFNLNMKELFGICPIELLSLLILEGKNKI